MQKKIRIMTIAVSLAMSGTTFAAAEGWGLGFGFGPTNVISQSESFTATTSTSVLTVGPIKPANNGFGARIFAAYSFNSYAAVEFGFTHYGSSSYKIPSNLGIVGSNPEVHVNAFDVLGKGSMPFFNTGLGVFAKAGLAVTRISQSKSLYTPTAAQITSCQSTSGGTPQLCSGSGTPSLGARPEVAVGVDYDFTPNWEIELEASRILKGGSIPNINFFSISFSYHWVDKYCGQFLC